MIDIHAHILPGIDDGPGDLDLSVDMCRAALASGTKKVVATPHQRHPTWWNTEPIKLERLLDQLGARLAKGPELYLGAEIRVDSGFLPGLDRLQTSGVQSLAGSSYLLLEFHRSATPIDPVEVVVKTGQAGWRPVIAHPEFLSSLRRRPELAAEMVEHGALMQVTAMSVTGDFGEEAYATAHRLLEADLVHFVASDAHDCSWRPPGLRKARKLLTERYGEEVAQRLTEDNPSAVLEDRVIEPTPATSQRG